MEKVWLKHYPKDIPHEVDTSAYRSVNELVDKTCAKYLNRPAFANMGTQLSFSDIDRLSRQFASYLTNVLGLKKGDRVALQMPNCLAYPVACFGTLRAGCIVVNTNPLYTAREMEHQFNDSGAKVVVILSNFAKHLEEALPKTKIETVVIAEVGNLLNFPMNHVVNFVAKHVKKMVPDYHLPHAVSFMDALLQGSAKTYQPVSVGPDDIAFLQYTGGTTGVSKGAVLLHRNIVANLLQILAWMKPNLVEGREVALTPLPLYHIFSLTANGLAFFSYGALNVLITNPRDMKMFIKTMRKYPFTIMTGVNTLFNGLLHQKEFASLNFSQFKAAVGGGMAVQQAVAEKWKKVTGKPLVEGFGLTESSPVLTVNPLDGRERIGCIGMPVPSTEIKIVKEDGTEAGFGERGELCAKGPQVMAGYWQRPEETAKVLKDGWLHTGDIAVISEDGYLKIVDRIKDMILVSGFNVYPNEIEDVLAGHPGVLEVAAVGVPDEKSGEAVKVFIVPKDPNLTVEAVKDYCKEQFTGYKRPRHVEFRKELPKTNVGKILRRALRDEGGGNNRDEGKQDGPRMG